MAMGYYEASADNIAVVKAAMAASGRDMTDTEVEEFTRMLCAELNKLQLERLPARPLNA